MRPEQSHDHSAGFDTDFYDWLSNVIQSSSGLPIMVLVIFFMSVMSEAVAAGIKRLRARPVFWIRSRQLTVTLHNLLSTLAHTIRVTLMFCMMVIFMALNPWLCIAVIGGAAAGHLLFHWSFVWESEAPDKDDLARSQW